MTDNIESLVCVLKSHTRQSLSKPWYMQAGATRFPKNYNAVYRCKCNNWEGLAGDFDRHLVQEILKEINKAPNPLVLDNVIYDFTPTRIKMKKWEWWRELRANFGGYFWAPCIICGYYFGGHEWKHDGQQKAKPGGGGTAICLACFEEGRGDDFSYDQNGNKIYWVKNDEPKRIFLVSPDDPKPKTYTISSPQKLKRWNQK
jgi:hypothetical protein